MATIDPVKVETPHDGSVKVIRWTPVTEADICTPYPVAFKADRSVHVHGDFGAGGTVIIEGKNHPAVTTYGRLSTPGPTAEAISITAEAVKQILEMSYHVRPAVSAGANVEVTVDLIIIGQRV